MLRKIFISAIVVAMALCYVPSGAEDGDTTIVQTLTFDDIVKRRGVWAFPDDPGNYRKILMYYTLKCDPRTTRDKYHCGEWDYLTYTNIHRHTGTFDSTLQEHPLFTVGHQAPDTFRFTNEPMKNIYQTRKFHIENISTESENEFEFGKGDGEIAIDTGTFRIQFLIPKDELKQLDFDGKIRKIKFYALQKNILLKNFTVKIGNTTESELDHFATPINFLTVYKDDLMIESEGWQSIYFPEPLSWKSLFSILVDISFEYEGPQERFIAVDAGGSMVYSDEPDTYIDFDGEHDYVDCGNIEELSNAEKFTMEMWVRPEKWEKWNTLLTKSDRIGLQTGPAQGEVYCLLRDEVNTWGKASSALKMNAWTHIAMVYDGSGDNNQEKLRLFVNGEEISLDYRGRIPNLTPENTEPVTISSLRHNTASFDGGIDEVRIWKSALDEETIKQWYMKSVTLSHPEYDNLLAYYNPEPNSEILEDLSGSGHDGRLVGIPTIEIAPADRLFKNLRSTHTTPYFTIANGEYENKTTDTIISSTRPVEPLTALYWKTEDHRTVPDYNNSLNVWPGGWEYTYDIEGKKIDSNYVETTDQIVNSTLEYYSAPFEITKKLEIGRFITPYGIGLDLGPDGFTWIYDVTDYAHYLSGKVDLSAGNQQELIDLKFMFIEGAPPRDVIKVNQIWGPVKSYKYKNLDDDTDLSETKIGIADGAEQFKVRTRLTGHGHHSDNGEHPHCCEWKENTHYLMVDGKDAYEWRIFLHNRCAWNPVYPQGGTWPGAREGWCPGDVVMDYQFEITDFMENSDSVALDYYITPVPEDNQGMGNGNYVTAMHLMQYSAANHKVDAEIYDVIAPNDRPFYSRLNPICAMPRLMVRNNGEEPINSIKFKCSVSGGIEEEYTYNFTIDPHETVEADIPLSSSQFWLGDDDRVFTAEIVEVDGLKDMYPANDIYQTTFERPDLYKENLVFWYKTNLRPGDFTYQILNRDHEVVFEKSGLAGQTLYRDTLDLPDGCYTLRLLDARNFGLSYWAVPGQGNGYFRIYDDEGNMLKNFNPDFGGGLTYSFNLGAYNYVGDRNFDELIELYPVPAESEITIGINHNLGDADISIHNSNGERVFTEKAAITEGYHRKLDISDLPAGAYIIAVESAGRTISKKFIKK